VSAAWDDEGQHDNAPPGAPSRRPAPSRGQTFLFPAGSAAGAYAGEALRLDAGTWDIRVACVDQQGHIAPPSKVGALDPFGALFLELSIGVGAARWVEQTGFSWRGSHVIRTADQIDVRAFHALTLVTEQRVIVAAQRVVSPAPVATHLQTESVTIAGGMAFFVDVPNGAVRAFVAGPDFAANIECAWLLSNAAPLAVFLGQVGNAAPFSVVVPASAAQLQVLSIAGGNNVHSVTWEVEV